MTEGGVWSYGAYGKVLSEGTIWGGRGGQVGGFVRTVMVGAIGGRVRVGSL